MTEFSHISVLLEESVELLHVIPGGVYADGTLGGGGHSSLICSRMKGEGVLIGIDQDSAAITAASQRLQPYGNLVKIVKNNFSNIKAIMQEEGIAALDGAVLDLGVSSPQLDNGERGFSYNMDARLDMRMNQESSFSAYELLNTYTEEEIADIIFRYGEERYARRIAREIVKSRADKPLATTFELVECIKRAVPANVRFADKHPAKRTFQAIRIAVNRELDILEGALRDFVDLLKPGGRLAVITFHSLEDRIVKQTFADLAAGCTCPKEFPVCVCGNAPKIKAVNRKPIVAGEKELKINNRAHSAKLRAVEKL